MTIKIVAGETLYQQIQDGKLVHVRKNESGHFKSEDLCDYQKKIARLGIRGAQIVKSNYGYSVRYDSGLQDWGLIASARAGSVDGSITDAIRFCQKWVDEDPTRRYAWVMDYETLGV